MKKIFITIMIVGSILTSNLLLSQDFKIQTNSLDIINDKLVISYEFTDFKKSDKFEVWVVVTDGHNNRMVAKTFSGDLGMDIAAGIDKKIEWDYMHDNIVIHEEIGIEVKARLMTIDEIALQNLTVGKTMLQSTIYPGWGLTSATRKKAPLFLGAATYVSAGLGVYYQLESQKNYESYQTGGISSSESDFYKKSLTQNTMSKTFFIGAAGIWATSMVWTMIKTKKLKDAQKKKANVNQALILPIYDINNKFKGISLIYTF